MRGRGWRAAVIAAVTVPGLAGCGQGLLSDAPASPAELAAFEDQARARQAATQAAMNSVLACLHRAARSIDDGTSDPTSVALGLEPLCAAEWESYLTSAGEEQNLDANARVAFEAEMDSEERNVATTVVLQERQVRKKMQGGS